MKPIFLIAGGLLGVSGFLHLVELAMAGIVSNGVFSAVMVTLFSLAYLVTAYYLMRRSDTAVTFGILVPAIGLLAMMLGVLPRTEPFFAIVVAIDILVIAVSAYLYFTGRAPISRVR